MICTDLMCTEVVSRVVQRVGFESALRFNGSSSVEFHSLADNEIVSAGHGTIEKIQQYTEGTPQEWENIKG